MMRFVAAVAVFMGLAACGGDDDDSSNGTSTNALGQVCRADEPSDCPANHSCVVFGSLVGGSQTQGFCSPACQTAEDCSEGYTGPGSVACFRPPQCSISCSAPGADDECPEGLACLQTGGPTSSCGVPAE